jgi:hypothetical protein
VSGVDYGIAKLYYRKRHHYHRDDLGVSKFIYWQ